MAPIFCIFAHPDDEAFGPGGTIATFAKERDVYLICVTDGNAKDAFQSIKHENLGELRREELLASTKTLGVKKVFFLNYPDGTLCNNLYHEIAEKIEKILKEYKPDTLLTFSQGGISGHLDHIAVSMMTTFVYYRNPSIKKLLYYCELERKIAKMRNTYFIYMPQGCREQDADLTIDITSLWETKVKAMRQHHSQQKDIETILHNEEGEPKRRTLYRDHEVAFS